MSNVKLQLGDIIQIIAPADTAINEHVYYIAYIDENKLRLEEANGKELILTFTNGSLDNESIENIVIKSRAEETGYARQNNLITGVWVDIFFNGDLPLTITGKITNLEEDKIEVTLFPDNDIIFIDFAYRGLPEDLPLEKIQLRKAPEASLRPGEAKTEGQPMQPGQTETQAQQPGQSSSIDALERRYNDIQRQLLEIPDEDLNDEAFDFETQKNIQDQTRNYIFNADQIQFGDDLEAITQMVDVPEEEQRYDIDKQLDDLLDNMLSTIPNVQRTDLVKNNIHKMIQRFKQLRDQFSLFDDKGYALMPKTHGANYKPLIAIMEKMEKQLYWMLPVVKCRKKMYKEEGGDSEDEDEEMADEGGDLNEDTEMVPFDKNMTEEQEIVERYEGNTENEGNKYAVLQRELNPYLTPFVETVNKEDIIVNAAVSTTITAVVDNLGDFNSSVQGTDTFTSPHSANKYERRRKIQRKRFALQTYTVGSTGLEVLKVRGENPIIKRKELTKSDRLDLKSMLMLPEPTLRFSQINLHGPTIMARANLNMHFLNYWQLLRARAHIVNTTVTDVYNHEADTFLKTFHNFMQEQTDVPDKYAKFLDSIIPKTKHLFELIKPHLTGKLSINDILAYLEPFMIYHEDLNEIQYKDMNNYLVEKIAEYRKNHAAKSREYGAIRGSQNVLFPSLIKILDENANLKTKVLDVYGFTDTIMNMSNADFIRRIYAVDNGVFYNTSIALISVNLMIADGTRDMANIDLYLQQQQQERIPTTKTGKVKKMTQKTQLELEQTQAQQTQAQQTQAPLGQNEFCNKIKVIAKRYIEMDELTEDNGREIYFDKKYDRTSYDIGDKFKADQALPAHDQIKHYKEKLMKTKGLDEDTARRDAEAIVKRKRLVENGDYAILETTDEVSASLHYYVRTNENWVLDESIDPETFADDTKMFCNLNEKCISVKDKCEDENTGANEIKKHNLKLLLSEFNTTLNVNKDIISNKIEEELTSADKRIETLRQMRLVGLYKYDMQKITIGNMVDETKIILTSPYDGLLNTIMGQTDIAKRYLDISNFVKSFTREGVAENNESTYWYYCIKSNKKMLPTFLYKLATTFLTGGNFVQMLDKLCALQGTLSDDGDKYVDKYSGYTIKMIEMSTDEEYNEEGFKIVTRAVMEGDAGDVILQNLPTAIKPEAIKRKYATADATAIYNVVEALSTNMGLNIDDQKDFIVRNILKQLSNTSVMPTKAAYDKLFATMATKGKTIDTYEVAYNSTLLYLTFAYYLIAIQTSVPPIKTKTTFPGCKKSFSGFPTDGTDTTNLKGLNYVACVAFKIKNKGALPWSAIANRSETFIAKQMEATISKYILPTEEVQDSIKQLKLYLTENPESLIPAEHMIESWSNFLPPLKTIKMTSTQDVGEVFKGRLTESLRKGQKTQEDYIAELQSKMIMFSFNIIDLIEKTVHGEQAILKGKNGEPFAENACCDTGENNTIRYFVKKQPEIAILNNKVVRLSDMYDDTKKLGKAVLLYDPSNTKRKLREIETKFSEHTIYQAFIVYCKFNSLLPLSENLKAICPTKPENFDLNDTLEESIRKLKGNARNYNEHSLQQLLEIINNSTKVVLVREEKEITTKNKLAEIMAKMDAENKRPSVFRAAFMDIIEAFELNSLLEDTVQLRKFKNIVANLNEAMLGEITDFIGKFNTGVKKENIQKFRNCLETLVDFKDGSSYKMINFMKKAMRSLTGEFPNIIINSMNYDKVNAPLHWKLSVKHQADVKEIIKGHYSEFKGFYKDAQIGLLMRKMMDSTADVNALAQNTIFYSPVEIPGHGRTHSKEPGSKEQQAQQHSTAQQHSKSPAQHPGFKYSAFDLSLTTLLFKFYFLNVLTDLISFQNDREILQLPLVQMESSSESVVDEEAFMSRANEMDILAGDQTEWAEKIASVIVVFTNLICKDKSAIDYSYKGLMDLILRSKEKEKDDITEFLGKMTIEEREVENLFKDNKLGRWSKGQQKGIHTYDTATYDQERDDMEKMALREAKLNKRSIVTDMNRDIYALEMLNEEANNEALDQEDNLITYMGEDAEPEDYDMDGDENF